ncbi:MAG: 5'-nucleotidase C-terminal domain-containing protein, partial [Parasporobacterium sp.]|nr:5'-nucleotidase C-terminal domain-containing protein [Parasporobacterium sp.]
MYKASLNDNDSDIVGHCGEDIKNEALVQLIADILADTGLGDFALVTTGGVAENGSANRRGVCGVLYEGPVNETDLMVLQSDSRNIQVIELTGEQVLALLNNGKTTADNNYQEGLEATWTYTWSGIDVSGNLGSVSASFNGQEISPEKTYRVVFLYGDYPVEWKDTETIEDTGLTESEAIRQYVAVHNPLMAPEVK